MRRLRVESGDSYFSGPRDDLSSAARVQNVMTHMRPARADLSLKPSPPDNGTEFHDNAQLERTTGVAFYFATPHHSWERGTNENTNGLIRQYVPKGTSMAKLTQQRCNAIARALNNRPRKRLGFKTPKECLNEI